MVTASSRDKKTLAPAREGTGFPCGPGHGAQREGGQGSHNVISGANRVRHNMRHRFPSNAQSPSESAPTTAGVVGHHFPWKCRWHIASESSHALANANPALRVVAIILGAKGLRPQG